VQKGEREIRPGKRRRKKKTNAVYPQQKGGKGEIKPAWGRNRHNRKEKGCVPRGGERKGGKGGGKKKEGVLEITGGGKKKKAAAEKGGKREDLLGTREESFPHKRQGERTGRGNVGKEGGIET